jgi:glycosyltransferase involved in cell wall biosynthesis
MTYDLVSVLMPAFNAQAYVRQAIDSVLAQTYGHLELIVINDGSTDSTADIVASIADPRLRLFSNSENAGLAATRNRALGLAQGSFIAWLDSDDMSHPQRLARQVSCLQGNPSLGVCGAWVHTIGAGQGEKWRFPTRPANAHARMIFDNPVATSAVTMRRACLDVISRPEVFDATMAPAEDYDLWERLASSWGFSNLPRVLTSYRLHSMQTSVTQGSRQRDAVARIQVRLLSHLGLEVTPEQLDLHLRLGVDWGRSIASHDLPAVRRWLTELETANESTRYFDLVAFRRILQQRLHLAEYHAGPGAWRRARVRINSLRQ